MVNRWILIFLLYMPHHVQAQSDTVTTIAFGSCSHEYDTMQLWREVIRQNPNLWIWLGDIIYADTYDMAVMKEKYDRQKAHQDYQKLRSLCPIIGIWDDHDYGINDGGKEYSKKKESKDLLLEFLDVPFDASVRRHEGAYSSYMLGEGARKIKIILLDTRYFRDPIVKVNNDSSYRLDAKGDILGEQQWSWLEAELKSSDAALHIIGSSIQFIPTQQRYEKWMNFPESRERLLILLSTLKPNNAFFISGDRHIAEISKLAVRGLTYPLLDFTSSGLTHTWSTGWEENNFRIGDMIKQKNFGIIEIHWSNPQPKVIMKVVGEQNKNYLEYSHQY